MDGLGEICLKALSKNFKIHKKLSMNTHSMYDKMLNVTIPNQTCIEYTFNINALCVALPTSNRYKVKPASYFDLIVTML